MDSETWLRQLMATQGNAVLRLCYGYLKDAALAEDAAQETFLKAWQKRDSLQSGQSERAWVMRIAINTCKDVLRSAWFRHVDRRAQVDEELLRARDGLTPVQRDLWDAVMALKPADRMVILLHYAQGFSAGEIGQALGIGLSTVYYRLKRAQQRLHLEMEGDDQNEA